ncbi:hypothetical protein ACWD8L_11605 [Streptomyces sp. NPDC005133]
MPLASISSGYQAAFLSATAIAAALLAALIAPCDGRPTTGTPTCKNL